MSSTNRGGKRNAFDYYRTQPSDITHFLKAWFDDDGMARAALERGPIFDPCAGGSTHSVEWDIKGDQKELIPIPPASMSYPEALRTVLGGGPQIDTMDIREDSPAFMRGDFLTAPVMGDYVCVITNPPFGIALDIVRRALECTQHGGYVVMLLRLNFFGSAKRFPFFRENAPVRAYVHHERMGFTPNGKTDSIEYMHAIWRKGVSSPTTVMRVI